MKKRLINYFNNIKKIQINNKIWECALNWEFEKLWSSAVAYAWFIWEKWFIGDPSIQWI